MCGVTKMGKVKNYYIRKSLKVDEKLRSNRIYVLSMEVDEYKRRERSKKRW